MIIIQHIEILLSLFIKDTLGPVNLQLSTVHREVVHSSEVKAAIGDRV